MEGGRRRITLYDQMLAVGDSRELAGLTLNDVLTIHKRASPNPPPAVQLNSRTLLDIIRDDEFRVGKGPTGQKEKRYWKFLRDRLRLKRTVAAWTSSVSIPISEISIRDTRSHISPRNSVRFNSGEPTHEMMHLEESPDSASAPSLRPQISRRNSSRFVQNTPTPAEPVHSNDSHENINETDATPARSLRPQMSRHNSTRFSVERSESFADLTEPAREGTRRLSAALAEERALSAREAVAAQEAADAEAAAAATAEVEEVAAAPSTETAQPVRMSLMDLLEETDRQMGFEGSRYTIGDEDEEEEEDDDDDEENKREEVEDVSRGGDAGGGSGGEQNCCVCMVRHKGAAFIPCGHTFCRLCSRELWVSRGNCPLCNGFILEILDIF